MSDSEARPPAYRIVTPRLVVRCYDPADAPLIKSSIDSTIPHLRPWMPWVKDEPLPLQHKVDLLRRFRGQFDLGEDFTYGIFDSDERALLGGAGLHTRAGPGAREIGYWIHTDHIRRGYATEIVAALTRVAFEVDGVVRVEIRVDPENRASAGVPPKVGYTLEGTARRRIWSTDDTFHDALIFSLVKDDFAASPSAQARIQALDVLGRRLL